MDHFRAYHSINDYLSGLNFAQARDESGKVQGNTVFTHMQEKANANQQLLVSTEFPALTRLNCLFDCDGEYVKPNLG